MKLQLESENLKDYLKEIPPIIEFNAPMVQQKIKEIESKGLQRMKEQS